MLRSVGLPEPETPETLDTAPSGVSPSAFLHLLFPSLVSFPIDLTRPEIPKLNVDTGM